MFKSKNPEKKLPFEISLVQSFRLTEGSLRSVISIPGYCFDDKRCKIISGSSDGKVRIGNLDDGKLIRTLPGHYADVNCLCLLSDKTLVSGCDAGKVIFWKLPEFTKKRIITFRDGIKSSILCFCSLQNGNKLIIGDMMGNVYVYDLRKEVLSIVGNVEKSVYCFCVSKNEKILVCGGGVTDHPILVLWDIEDGGESIKKSEEQVEIPSKWSDFRLFELDQKRISSVCTYQEDEREKLISASHGGEILLWDITSKPFLFKEIQIGHHYKVCAELHNLILFPSHMYVLIGGFKLVYFINLRFLNMKKIEFEIHEGDVNELFWVEERKTFLSYCFQSGKILVHDILPDFRVIDLQERIGFLQECLGEEEGWNSYKIQLFNKKIFSYQCFLFCG